MMAAPHTPPLLDAALAWHDAGVCVLPAAPDGSKRPAVAWADFQRRRPARTAVPTMLDGVDGIGIVCGAVSGNLEMFELEAAAVQAGLELELRDLFESTGCPQLWSKLQTYVEASPAGGIHWIYRVDGPVPGNTKLARRRVDGVIQVLMETRGEGGWVVVSPSGGRTHPTGRSWAVLPGSRPGDVPTLTVDEHQTLHRLARSFDTVDTLAPVLVQELPAAPRQPGERTPGDEFNERTDWADILVPAGWTHVATRGGTRYWRRPGKNVGFSASTGFGDMGLDLLYVFTTSTVFESERSYSKFGAYTLLNHGGNFQTAGRALRQAGLGSPLERTNPLTLIPGGLSVTDGMTAPHTGQLAAPTGEQPEQPTEDPPSWAAVDLTNYLDGTFTPQVPELLARADGQHLMYAGRVHSLHGESESGKSWVALHVAAEQMMAGHNVIMIDFESDPHTTVGRLLRLGVPAATIGALFDYRQPQVNPQTLAREFTAWTQLLAGRYTVAVLDGVTEALAVYGVTSKDNDEVTGWIRAVPRRLAVATGAAVVLVDHVTKDAESRGRFAIGGQAKMAALDGAAYVVEVVDPLGVGLVGRVTLRVAKDRPGGVRPHAGPYRKADRTQEAAVITIDSSRTDITTVRVEGPRDDVADENGERKPFKPTGLMQRISMVLENANCAMSRNALDSSVKARREYIMQAIDCLVTDGYAAEDGPARNGGRPTVRLIRPYREGGDPFPSSDPADLVQDPVRETPTRSRSKDRGTGERVGSPSDTHSVEQVGNTSGTGAQEPLDGLGDLDE
jgi:hypothetical protein